MLKKEFKRKDVNRAHNLITGKVNAATGTQIGYNKRDYLANHGVERESALDFYKGFLAHKGSNSAVNRIINIIFKYFI